MLKDTVINKLTDPSAPIGADRSRCLRMRFDENRCAECISSCRLRAINIHEDISIDSGLCSGCMLCVSACPSDCFEVAGMDFYAMIGRLGKIGHSVGSGIVGCRAGRNNAHEKTLCYGFLSEEHLIALLVFLKKPLGIDVSGCAGCANEHVVGILERRIADVEAKTSIGPAERLWLIRDKADLNYHEVEYDRRGFFNALKNMTFVQAAGFFDTNDSGDRRSYSSKKLPFKRELLNSALKVLPYETGKNLLDNYYYRISVTGNCNNCSACIGMCPSGALKAEDGELFFNASLCNGCGLCRGFCTERAIVMEKGFSRGTPFEFTSLKKELLCEV